jgi:hypothetical protein
MTLHAEIRSATDLSTVSRLLTPALLLIITIAAVLRLAGVYDDFWMDEIWSWHIANTMEHPLDVLLNREARSDNNHPLNTWLMMMLGRHPHWQVYRAPAVVAGIAAVVAAMIFLRRRGAVEMLVGALLLGFSYPLVQFSSEARGYALAVCFALVGLDALDRYLRSRGWISNAIFVISCALGSFAHLSFIHFLAGAIVWSAWRLWRETEGWPSRVLIHLARLHAIPMAAVALLYLTFVRHLTIGGAPYESRWSAIRDAIGGLLGAGDSRVAAIALISLAAALFVAALVDLRRRGDELWIFLLIVVIVSPALVLARQVLFIEHRQPIAPRYFLVPYAFFLIAIALMLAQWLRQQRRGALRWCAAAIIAAGLSVNLWHTSKFLRIGRGQYLDAVLHMSEHTPAPYITVLADDRMRTAMVLDFYRRWLPPAQAMVIYDGSANPPAPQTHGPPIWIIVHSNQRGVVPENYEAQGYVFDREFGYYGLSGYSWYVYRHRSLK